jgi:hypothetical protein
MEKKNILIIIILIFLFIYWFQESEKYNKKNKNKNKVKKTIDKLKLPLLVGSFIYLIFCLNDKNKRVTMNGGSNSSTDFLEIFTNQPEF